MKFTNVLRGKRAERRVEVPGFQNPDGTPFAVLMVPITGLEYEAACADARARAVEKKVENPRLGDPIYDLALQAFILARGCVDPDSPETARQPSFSSGEQILAEMNPEAIVFLHEHHEAWQDECSPYEHRVTASDFLTRLREVAGPTGAATFMGFSPSMRWNFTHFLANQHLNLLEGKSVLGSSLEPSSEKSVNAPNAKKKSGRGQSKGRRSKG